MAMDRDDHDRRRQPDSAREPVLSGDEYEQAYGERLSRTLDIETWQPGADLIEMYAHLEREVAAAVRSEGELQKVVRDELFPYLLTRPQAPAVAGRFVVPIERLQEEHRKLLFNGGIEASFGKAAAYETLPLTITQIGLCLVSYQGDQGSWAHRIFRRDLRAWSGRSPVDEALDILEARRRGGGSEGETSRDRLSELATRGIRAFAERAALLRRSNAQWLMGAGSPAPYELITGSGMPQLLRASLPLLRELVLERQRFVFVAPQIRERHLRTIGSALRPLEYILFDTLEDPLERIAAGHYRGQEWDVLHTEVRAFVEDCGPRVIVGLFRASPLAPPQLFYAHVDHVHLAAMLVLADSVLQEHVGSPLLLELAKNVCNTTFGADSLMASTRLAFASVGEPYRYTASVSGAT
jgi:hypothetical protein